MIGSQYVKLNAEILNFLLLGSVAALVNWLARFPLSLFMTFEHAVIGAYLIGMVCGYILYKRYVFVQVRTSTGWWQITKFLLVNLLGLVVVGVVTHTLVYHVLPVLFSDLRLIQAIGHGLGIGASSATSFLGHKWFTFAGSRQG